MTDKDALTSVYAERHNEFIAAREKETDEAYKRLLYNLTHSEDPEKMEILLLISLTEAARILAGTASKLDDLIKLASDHIVQRHLKVK